MADKTVTLQELAELRDSGAEFEFDRRPLEIGRIGELIEKIEELVKAQEARTRADLDRSQANLEVLATLQTMIRKQGGVNRSPPLDLSPLSDMLADIQTATELRSQTAYDVDIKRTGQGYLDKFRITPIPPTIN